MKLQFLELGWEQFEYWRVTDAKTATKISDFLKDCRRSPYSGIGKPEPLKGNLSGWWSRRIDEKNRLVYRVQGDVLIVAQCRFHYDDR